MPNGIPSFKGENPFKKTLVKVATVAPPVKPKGTTAVAPLREIEPPSWEKKGWWDKVIDFVFSPTPKQLAKRVGGRERVDYTKLSPLERQFVAGFGDVFATAGGAAQWLGQERLRQIFRKIGQPLKEEVPFPEMPELGWKSAIDPKFWGGLPAFLSRITPFSLSLVPAMIAGYAGGAYVAGALGVSALWTAILGGIGATALSRPMESALEAGGVYDEALFKNMTSEQANEAANSVFWKNMTLAGLDVTQMAGAFLPTPARIAASPFLRIATIGGKVIVTGLSEAGEEAIQEVFQKQALGEPVVLDQEMKLAMLAGGIMGAGMGSAGAAFTAIKERSTRNMPPDIRAKFDTGVKDRVDKGFSPDQAVLASLDEMAQTPEGHRIIEEATQQVQKEDAGIQIEASKARQKVTPEAPLIKPPVVKLAPETAKLVARRTEIEKLLKLPAKERLVGTEAEIKRLQAVREMLVTPAKELPKGVKKIALRRERNQLEAKLAPTEATLRKELGKISAKLVPAEKKLRQKIMATAITRGIAPAQRVKIFKEIGKTRHLSEIELTNLEKILPLIQTARPTKIKGANVLTLETERNIQSLKDILIAEQRLTPEIYESIKKDLELLTDRFESTTQFITESEARRLIREMNYEAESGLAEWDARATDSLADKPNIKAGIDELSHTIEQENLPLPKRRTRINWRKFAREISEVPDDVGLSGTMSVLRALRRFQEQLGGRSATRIYDIAEMMIETRRLNDLRLTQRTNEMKAEVPSLMTVVQSEESMVRVQQWLDADLAVAKVEKPFDITDAELETAKLFRREYDQWKDDVRFERFKDAYYHYQGNAEKMVTETPEPGDVAILETQNGQVRKDIKKAIGIYEGQGETALNEFLKTKTWGVLESGYSFSQVIHPQLRIGRRISVRATTASLHQRKGLEFRKDERSAWERLIAYERQMIGLNLQPFFRKTDREFRHIVKQGRLADAEADASKISLFLQEVKGFPIESPVVRVLLRIGGWSFGTLAKVPWMSIRNLHQNLAFHPDKAEVVTALATGGFFADPITRNDRIDYTDALVHQFKGVAQEQLLMGYMGKTPLENLIIISDYYHLSDKLNRLASMAGSGAKAERALKAFQKDGNIEKFLRNSGANQLSQTEQIRILEYLAQPSYDYGGVLETVSGGEAAIREIGKSITTLTHFNYVRYLRSIVEMGEMGRVIGSLVAFPRGVVERYFTFFSQLRPARELSGATRRRAFHSLMAMVVGSAVASVLLSTITGKKRDAYNPLLVLQWQVGGLAIGAAQELTELYRQLSNLAFAKEESEKDYALKELAILIPRLGDMFIPFYAPTMNALEGLYDERYIDRKMLRQLRAMFDESYKPNLEFYEKERTIIEAWQHGLFGTRTPDPTDLEGALSKLKGIQDNLGKVDEEALERAKQNAWDKGEAFTYLPSDYIYTTSNLGSDFNSAIYGLDPTVITQETGFSPLLLDYLEYQALFDDYKAVPAGKRYEFREQNPITDANLFFWGYATTLQSETARSLVEQMMGKYNIPIEAIPALVGLKEKTEGRARKGVIQPPSVPSIPTRPGGIPDFTGDNPFRK